MNEKNVIAQARAAAPAATAPNLLLDRYDAGLLSDFGGGNVEWWQDYLRAELERAHDHYQTQADGAVVSQQPVQAASDERQLFAKWAYDTHTANVRTNDNGEFADRGTAKMFGAWKAGRAAPVIGASTAPTDEQIEAAAKAIYERFLGSEAHPWVERGNSIKQDDARYYARAALKAASLGASTATGEPVATFPERDPSKPAEQQGLFRKFEVRRVDGSDQPGGKHHGCRYYVLDLNHDQHAPAAMRAYAASCRATHPQLADDIEAEFGAPAPQQAAPLTAERIEQIWDEVPLTGAYTMAEARIKFARAIERALSAGSAASAGDAREIVEAVRKLVKAKGRFHTEQNYRALADALDSYDRAAMAATKEQKQ